MSQPPTIAILTANPALTELLASGLEVEGWRVSRFDTAAALVTFVRISPVDAVVLDGDMNGPSALELTSTLRRHSRPASPLFEVVALTRARPEFRLPFEVAGVDLVLAKPISAERLASELRARLDQVRAPLPVQRRRLEPRRPGLPLRLPTPQQWRDNVVRLFGASP